MVVYAAESGNRDRPMHDPATASDARVLTPRRRWLFGAIALAIPVAFFLLIEAGLRVSGAGAYPPLFVPAAGAEGYLQPNDDAMTRFFAHPAQAPTVSIDTTYFRDKKAAGALRIFVQGGSSAAGFPYGKWASPAGMLKRRLRRSYPEREIEVISTAMSAINSYALLDFADEIIAREPDAVVIYAGHNEYLGVLGVGSAYSSSRSRRLSTLILKLRRLHTYRVLERLIAREPETPKSGTLMARIAGERAIPFRSELYARGAAQYRGNLDALLARYRAAGVPVFIGTLASNERHQPPFANVLAPETDATLWQARQDAGMAALEADAHGAAAGELEAAVALDDIAAASWYALGRAHDGLGNHEAARAAYRNARDRDALRFRAPGEFNDIVRELAVRHDAVLVDVQAAMTAASPDGIVGNELLLEHLHPNVRGYFVLADAFFDALVAAGLAGDPAQAIDEDTAWAERPVTEIDALAAQYRLNVLLADWPFRAEKQAVRLPPATTPPEQIAQAWYTNRLSWPDAMNRALVYYQRQGDIDNAVRVALNLAEAFHFIANVQHVAGQLLLRQGNVPLGISYLARAVELDPRPDYALALARAQHRGDRTAAARETLNALLSRHPNHDAARRLLDLLQGVR